MGMRTQADFPSEQEIDAAVHRLRMLGYTEVRTTPPEGYLAVLQNRRDGDYAGLKLAKDGRYFCLYYLNHVDA